jgi:asparagine synthase (glutamine-hydrolysing)
MFCCILNLEGERVDPTVRERYAAKVGALAQGDSVEEVDAGMFQAWVVPSRVPLRPLWASRRGRVAVGNVRLDHPDEVRRWAGARQESSPLEQVLDALDAKGDGCLAAMLGDFSLVVHDATTGTLIAARDAFGVKTLFVAERRHILIFSSHLELVHDNEEFDQEFIADFLLGGDPGPERTIWADSRAVAPGTVLHLRNGKLSADRFWAPSAFQPSEKAVDRHCERASIEGFRALFRQAVRGSVSGADGLWAELSGGLDSSSIVCMAHSLRNESGVPELLGTATLVDELGAGDERVFSDLVVERTGWHNQIVPNLWPWYDDGEDPPCTDEPRTHYPFFARDRRYCRTIRTGGARVLLSGMGSDHYLYGNRAILVDLLACGRPLSALAHLLRWSVAERRSVWTALWRDLLLPCAPRGLQIYCAPRHERVAKWFAPDFAKKVSIADRLAISRTLVAPAGQRFGRQVANDMQELTRWLQRGPYEESFEMRYPFLYRPLVEFAMQLPATLRMRPLAQKWVLREAMRGMLPEAIRLRPSKGGIEARVLWALARERHRVDEILRCPRLGELGIVKSKEMRAAVERAANGQAPELVMLFSALALETWMFVRAGRWHGSERLPS